MKDALLKKRLSDRQIRVAYDYLTSLLKRLSTTARYRGSSGPILVDSIEVSSVGCCFAISLLLHPQINR